MEQHSGHSKTPQNPKKHDDSFETYIYRPSITLKSGRKIYARNYGLKAFKIKI